MLVALDLDLHRDHLATFKYEYKNFQESSTSVAGTHPENWPNVMLFSSKVRYLRAKIELLILDVRT